MASKYKHELVGNRCNESLNGIVSSCQAGKQEIIADARVPDALARSNEIPKSIELSDDNFNDDGGPSPGLSEDGKSSNYNNIVDSSKYLIREGIEIPIPVQFQDVLAMRGDHLFCLLCQHMFSWGSSKRPFSVFQGHVETKAHKKVAQECKRNSEINIVDGCL